MEVAARPSIALAARLARYGLLSVTGDDARAFLHAQLTNDIEHLSPERAALAGWCSAKGRLLASFLVLARPDGFLLQLARDLAPAIAKRLALYVLRSKVRLTDLSDAWVQIGLWGEDAARGLAAAGFEAPSVPFGVSARGGSLAVNVGGARFLVLSPAAEALALERDAGEQAWALEEIRAGRPLITAATQDRFVPQMVNLEVLGAVDFHKGCYPGQEVVARTQYRGQLKRRMVRARVPEGTDVRPGQELRGDSIVVDATGGEMLAVVPIGSADSVLETLPLPYAT